MAVSSLVSSDPVSVALVQLAEMSGDGLALLDGAHRCLFLNAAGCALLRTAEEELLGRDFVLQFAPQERAAIVTSLSAAAARPCRWSSILRYSDAPERAIEFAALPCIVAGEAAIAVTLRDISGQRQLERRATALALENARLAVEQLREKEQQYRDIFNATSDAIFIVDTAGYAVEVNPAACAMYDRTYEEMVKSRHRVLAPSHIEEIQTSGHYQGRTINRRNDGTPFHVEGRATTFTYKGTPHFLLIARDVTEQVQAQELLEQRVAERTRELSTLLDVSHHVGSTLELQPLLELILDKLKVVAEYTGSSLVLFDGEEAVVIATRGPDPEEHVLQRRFPLDRGRLIWDTIGRGEAIIADDVRSATPTAHAYRNAVGDLLETTFTYVRSWLAVPLMFKERVMGMLALSHRDPGYFSLHHATLAQAIATQAAVSIENARLYERAQEVAIGAERQRLSRELHDSVSQVLYSIALGTKTAHALLEPDSRALESVEFVLAQAQRGLAEMRALIFELRPETLEQDGLAAALQRQVNALQAQHQFGITTALCAEPDAPLPVKEALYRIAQEALHNTTKHGRAATVEVRLEENADGLTLEVRDDGAGFDTSGSFPGHLGLHTMQERAVRLGGTLEVVSAPGAGTRVRAHIPARRPE